MLREVGFDRVEVVAEEGAAEMLGVSGTELAACACSDPLVASVIPDLMKSVPLEDLLQAARLVVSVQISAHRAGGRV